MAKAKKQSLENLRKSMAAKVAHASVETQEPEFKVSVSHVKKIAAPIIAHVKSAHVGLRDVLIKLLGEHPLTLEATLKQVKDELGDWLKEQGRKLNPQSVYNMQSDITAAIRAFQKYAALDKAAAKKWESNMPGSYHAFISYCRKMNRKGKAGKAKRGALKPEERRIVSQWKNHKAEAMAKAKDLIRFADTDSIRNLIEFAETLIEARKKGNVLRMDGFIKAQQQQEQAKQKKAA